MARHSLSVSFSLSVRTAQIALREERSDHPSVISAIRIARVYNKRAPWKQSPVERESIAARARRGSFIRAGHGKIQ